MHPLKKYVKKMISFQLELYNKIGIQKSKKFEMLLFQMINPFAF